MSNVITFKGDSLPLKDAIAGLLLQNGKNQILWFIGALYVYSLCFYFVEHFCNTGKKMVLAVILLFIANEIYAYVLHGPAIPWHINTAGFACSYMALGKLYKMKEEYIDSKVTNRILLLTLFIYAINVLFTSSYISFFGGKFLFGLNALFVTILGLTLCVYTSKRFLKNSKFLLFIGANSLFFFAFHGKAYALLQALITKGLAFLGVSHLLWLDIFLGFLITVADALLLIMPALLVNRYCPFILGKNFKLWKVKV